MLRKLSSRFQIETLYRFNKKFSPTWLPRYLAVEAIEDLPRVARGVLRLEGLLAPPHRQHRQEPHDHDQPAPDDRALRIP
jgi:lysyl-tRNA synthetase class 2